MKADPTPAMAMLRLSTIMDHHIRYNHYPPPKDVAKVVVLCCGIVRRYNGIGEPANPDLDYEVETPNGGKLTALQVVEAFHLHDFLEHTES